MGWQDAPVVEEGGEVGQPAWMSAPPVDSAEEAMQPTAKAAPVEKSDWESAKESLGKFSFDEYLQQNASVNAGLYARKKITGDRTEGTLTFPNQELGFMDAIKETGKFFAEKPITAFVELAKGIIYNPELLGLGAFQSVAHAARLAEAAKLGATARAIAVTGASAVEGGGVPVSTVSGEYRVMVNGGYINISSPYITK
jgi:hypothetical protein